MVRRTTFVIMAGLATSVALGSPTSFAQSRTLKMGYILAQDSQLGAGSTAFAKELEAATGGRLKVEQFPNSALGGEVEMLKGVQLGSIDLAFITGAPLPNIITATAVGAIEGIVSTITSMNEIGETIAAAVEEQTAATREIADNVSRAAVETRGVSDHIGAVIEAAHLTGKSSQDVVAAADQLACDADSLRTEVDSYLASTRVA